jgi:tetratricopeptide (TPR) repeat protein
VDETAAVFCRRNGANQPLVERAEPRLLLAMAGPDASREQALGQAVLSFLHSRRPLLLERLAFPFDAFYRANYALQLRRGNDAQVAYLDLLQRERGSLHWSRHRIEILNNLIYCLAPTREHEAVAGLIDAVARDRSTRPEQRLMLGLHKARALEQMERGADAERIAREIAADPRASEEQRWAAWCRIASVRTGLEDYEEAAAALEAATAARPSSAETFRSLGAVLDQKLHRASEAIAAYEAFLRLEGSDPLVEERVRELRTGDASP